MTKPRQPKWIQTQYDMIEHYGKYRKHKLTKREFMKGFNRKEEPEKIDDKKEDS